MNMAWVFVFCVVCCTTPFLTMIFLYFRQNKSKKVLRPSKEYNIAFNTDFLRWVVGDQIYKKEYKTRVYNGASEDIIIDKYVGTFEALRSPYIIVCSKSGELFKLHQSKIHGTDHYNKSLLDRTKDKHDLDMELYVEAYQSVVEDDEYWIKILEQEFEQINKSKQLCQ